MKRVANAPILISGLFATAQILWSMRLAIEPDPLTVGAALLLISGIVVYTVISVVGILLVRAPWARWLALYTTVVTLVVGTLRQYQFLFSRSRQRRCRYSPLVA